MNAYFKHADAQEFLARRGDRVVGRISAQIDGGERMYTGVLETYTQGDEAKAVLRMSAPLIMELQAQVTQKPTWPWRFTVEAPRFDPRNELLPDSSLTSLAVSVAGHGSTDQGAISGKLAINDEPLLIQPSALHAQRRQPLHRHDPAYRPRRRRAARRRRF